jgi:tripartite-type tricarboxylate transporter receptor subunit TctC
MNAIAGVLAAAAVLGCAQAVAQVQDYPSRPVRIIVGFPPGGGADTIARLLGKKLGEAWSQGIVVENRPGADAAIATELTVRSAPDGYTILMTTNAHTITPFQRKLSYDPVKDVAPVSLVASTPNLLLVHPALPVRTQSELIALAKKRPRELAFASSGTGTSPYLSMELFKMLAGIDMVHVPYKGSGPAVIDLMGGHVQVMFGAVSTTLPYVKAGKLRVLSVSSTSRIVAAPDVPTVAEAGVPGFEARSWYGLLAPAKTNPEIVQKIAADVATMLRQPDVVSFLATIGFDPVGNRPAEFAEVIRSDMVRWGKVIRAVQAAEAKQ